MLNRVEHGFSPACLPGPYFGRLRTAPVVLLLLSPGLDTGDKEHCAGNAGRKYYALQRTGDYDLPTEGEHSATKAWLTKIIRQFGITYEQAQSTVAVLNIGAYKSKTFDDWAMLTALPSSRASLDWAQNFLFPQAVKGERIVVCLRSADYWGLGTGEAIGKSLFRPKCTRGAIMHKGEIRDQIATTVKAAVQKAIAQQQNSN